MTPKIKPEAFEFVKCDVKFDGKSAVLEKPTTDYKKYASEIDTIKYDEVSGEEWFEYLKTHKNGIVSSVFVPTNSECQIKMFALFKDKQSGDVIAKVFEDVEGKQEFYILTKN